MKQSTILRSAAKELLVRIFFCSQLVVTSLALPSLFYVGINYNSADKGKISTKHVITTNKGKKILADKKAENDSIIYPAFLEI